jgi:oligopeptide transport system substrate-binding protein
LGKNIADGRQIADFPQAGTRELTLPMTTSTRSSAWPIPALHSPIFGMMADKIVGLKELGEALQ